MIDGGKVEKSNEKESYTVDLKPHEVPNRTWERARDE